MTFSKTGCVRSTKPQRALLLLSTAMLSAWAMPAFGQEIVTTTLIGDDAEADVRCTALADERNGRWTGEWRTTEGNEASECDILLPPPAPPPGSPVRVEGAALDDATTIRYDGGVFQESAAGWTETRDSGEVFTYDLVMALPNQIILHDAARNVQANITAPTREISVGAADGVAGRTHQITAMEAVPRTYPRPARVGMDGLETADFEGGQLRRSLFGRWIRHDDNGQCTLYRLRHRDRGYFELWNENSDVQLMVNLDRMMLTSIQPGAGGQSQSANLRLTGLSAERISDPMSDCDTRPAPLEEPRLDGASAPFPVETVQYHSGIFTRTPEGLWRQMPMAPDVPVRGSQDLVYNVVDSNTDTLILYNEEDDVFAEVVLSGRFLGIFSTNGVVDHQHLLTMAGPNHEWTTMPSEFVVVDMTRANYTGGQLRRGTVGNWVDAREGVRCGLYQEWYRNFRSIVLVPRIGSGTPNNRIVIDVQLMTVTIHDGPGANAPVAETRELIETSVEPVAGDPYDGC
jgi:hypothetical protein